MDSRRPVCGHISDKSGCAELRARQFEVELVRVTEARQRLLETT
jgi:hypothetical protein